MLYCFSRQFEYEHFNMFNAQAAVCFHILNVLFSGQEDIKMPLVDVNLLDGSMTQLNLSGKATGDDLLSEVCQSINLLEKDYFGLSHYDKKEGTRCWIQPDRKLTKQVKDFNSAIMFQVRFYPPDPSQLQEDLTRYQLCLQIHQDVKT